MRAEAEGEGQLRMLKVGNIGVNRVLATCLAFKISANGGDGFQRPGDFEATSDFVKSTEI